MACAGAGDASALPDFVLFGPGGFLGAALLQALEATGHNVVTSRVRLQDRASIERFLDEHRPSVGVICAAGERGRPNISWCDDHPVETLDVNITGQLSLAAACHARGLHVVLLGTGAFYTSDLAEPSQRFSEEDTPNLTSNVYLALRHKMEELLAYFDNALVLRVLYPVSSDLDPRGLLGKLARFSRVDGVQASVTVLEDLCPLVPALARRRVTGVLNFVNRGTLDYPEVVRALAARAASTQAAWHAPEVDVAVGAASSARAACELDVTKLAAACGQEIPDASASVRRIIARLGAEDFAAVAVRSKL